MSKTFYNPEKIIKIKIFKEFEYNSRLFYYKKGLKILWGKITITKEGFYDWGGELQCTKDEDVPKYYKVKRENGKVLIYTKPEVQIFYQDNHSQSIYCNSYEEALKKAEEIRLKSEVKMWIEE